MNPIQEKEPLLRKPGDTVDLGLRIPHPLLERVRTYCDKHGMLVDDFIMDAIAEKLELSHKERRKKPRI
jgi:hypothetical protein